MPEQAVAVTQWILNGGSVAVLVAVGWLIVSGKLRTSQEIDAYREQVNKVLPALDKAADAIEALRTEAVALRAEIAALKLRSERS